MEEVCEWLQQHNAAEAAPYFRASRVDGPVLTALDDSGLVALGVHVRIPNCIPLLETDDKIS